MCQKNKWKQLNYNKPHLKTSIRHQLIDSLKHEHPEFKMQVAESLDKMKQRITN